ncbi:hypothetical protein EZV62_028237 [Acer yangbiense]|uniref:Uncharacterized protein n=1 Tax=Acer yangbiense TaxID=1000413 RepID=A0A5C7GNX0_9ROSI|nr:hypothetical protein EZV62_028237 [Acer yangbiense]
MSDITKDAWRKYLIQLQVHPLRTKAITAGVLLEQLTSSPWNNMVFMMYYGLVIEGRPFGFVKNKVRKDYPSVQLTAWKFWPIVGWVNYQYMPPQFRGNLSQSESKISCNKKGLDMKEPLVCLSLYAQDS